jgi:hypothetical protein
VFSAPPPPCLLLQATVPISEAQSSNAQINQFSAIIHLFEEVATALLVNLKPVCSFMQATCV